MTSGNSEIKKNGGAAANISAASVDLPDNLRRLDRLANLGLVSASVAHEIKNGLVAISTFVELLLQKGDDNELAEMVRRELKRIDALTTQMMRFSSPKPAARTRVRTHELLDHSLRLLEHTMSGRMISLKRDYRAAPDAVQGDESQLQQALMNLLLNAVEAVGSNGEVTVVTENAGGRLKISIRDTGPGISTENLARLFEPFFTTKKQGTGLGLAICQRVMDEHHGKVEVHSETGKGSMFTLSLPLE